MKLGRISNLTRGRLERLLEQNAFALSMVGTAFANAEGLLEHATPDYAVMVAETPDRVTCVLMTNEFHPVFLRMTSARNDGTPEQAEGMAARALAWVEAGGR